MMLDWETGKGEKRVMVEDASGVSLEGSNRQGRNVASAISGDGYCYPFNYNS